jgi:adenosylcobinamide kinase/adenosylcobinamide-phosphate guanylyltransferase
MGRLTLILGGARGGKSTYAQSLAMERSQHVTYIATAQAMDEEMRTRIAIHQQERPGGWRTIEASKDIAKNLTNETLQQGVILLDCLTMLVSNILLEAGGSEDTPDEINAVAAVETEINSLMDAIHTSKAEWIIVSNEVGMGLVPPYPLGRLYRDLLGKTNQQIAKIADDVYLLVAGIPVPLHQFAPGSKG